MNKLIGALSLSLVTICVSAHADTQRAKDDAAFAEAKAREAAAQQREAQIRTPPEPKPTPEPKATPEPKPNK